MRSAISIVPAAVVRTGVAITAGIGRGIAVAAVAVSGIAVAIAAVAVRRITVAITIAVGWIAIAVITAVIRSCQRATDEGASGQADAETAPAPTAVTPSPGIG